MSGPTVAVMAKAPQAGTVKTRLEPMLGATGCAALQSALIRHTVGLAVAMAPTVLAFSPAGAAGELCRLAGPGVPLIIQVDGDLGRRMAAVVSTVAAERPGGVVLIGTDAPTLPAATLAEATALVRGGRAVLGPALDGGYYLLGLPGPVPAAFALEPGLWGGPRVLAATLAALDAAGHPPALLPALRDLDTPADAAALLADPALPPSVASVLLERRRAA